MWVIELFVNLLNPILELQHAPLTPKCCESRSMPQLRLLPLSAPLDLQLSPSRSLGVHHMGYWFNKQTSFASFFLYFLFFRCEPQLLASIHWDVDHVVNLYDPNMWVKACEQHVALFKIIMPLAMENLAIAQHWNTLQYGTIHVGRYWPKNRTFEHEDYVYL